MLKAIVMIALFWGITGVNAADQYTLETSLAGKIELILAINRTEIAAPWLLLDKIEGRIYVVSSTGQVIAEDTALVGKELNDYANMDLYFKDPKTKTKITPAGIFTVKRYKSTKYGGEILTFIEGPMAMTAIHRVYLGNAAEHRKERLMSSKRADRRITNGCVNVSEAFFDEHLKTITDGTKLFILPETISEPTAYKNFLTVSKGKI